ncbi:MAG TPA: N-acetyl-gamma-glutamyl-phosphate reductase, partial [Deltaproteobacteria bacterium]|nr:N-acetyl-gamma-glutamyl-phosphate reductase [Deltaproteobacteria bacterium]
MKSVYVDGQHGTTGLEIMDRLARRTDIELLTIGHEQRRDAGVREKLLNEADLVFLCLPDDAAREAVKLIRNPATRVIDASTAHRTAPGWVYGLPEIAGQREKIAAAQKIANPGCYATGFILMLRPLVEKGIVAPTYPV